MVEFDQSIWLALRTKVKNDSKKDFFNLMNSSVFGKTIENIRKHKGINLITNLEAYLKRVTKPNFRCGIQFSENLVWCACSQTFEYGPERNQDMKFQLHHKVCSNPPDVYE